MIEKVTKAVTKTFVKKPAHYKEIDGEKVFVEAVKGEREEDVTLWQYNDGNDIHEFSCENDAKRFIEGL